MCKRKFIIKKSVLLEIKYHFYAQSGLMAKRSINVIVRASKNNRKGER